MTLLSIKDVTVHYQKVPAVKGISIDVNEGEIVTLIGANGAGKSTTLRTISGLNRPTAGEILFEGQKISGMAPDKINARGIAQSPEGRRVFPYMSVLENLEMGSYLRTDAGERKRNIDRVYSHFPILVERRNQLAGTLSGGQQQMVAIGRALMSNPKVLLLDEPTLGLSPLLCQEIAKIIRDVHKAGLTVVLVEQNARLALNLADRGYVMETGLISLEGHAAGLRDNEDVQKTYLGG